MKIIYMNDTLKLINDQAVKTFEILCSSGTLKESPVDSRLYLVVEE